MLPIPPRCCLGIAVLEKPLPLRPSGNRPAACPGGPALSRLCGTVQVLTVGIGVGIVQDDDIDGMEASRAEPGGGGRGTVDSVALLSWM